jgi:hypothetical protein
VNPEVVNPKGLAAALAAQAEGSYAAEAAAGLLIEHRSWLARADFRAFVDVAFSLGDDGVLMASVDWEAAIAANLPASSSEAQMLAVAAELAGVDTGRSLQDLLCGLDRANTTLVIRAVLHAQRGANTTPVTVTPFGPARRRTEKTPEPLVRDLPPAGGWIESEGPGL